MKNEKGITLIVLVITIIVMLILAGVATYSGIQNIEGIEKTAFISEMEMIQAKVNGIYEERKNNESKIEYYDLMGQDISFANQSKVSEVLGETKVDGFKYFQAKDLENIGLSGIYQEVLINYDTREVISLKGTKINGIMYYKLKDIPDYIGYNVEYKDKNTEAPDFEIEHIKLSDNEYRITIKDIVYNSNVNGGTLKYKLHNQTNWLLNGESTSFTITQPGLYDICFTDKAGNEAIKQELVNKFDYIGKGLLAYYDAENNTGDGNKQITTWKDLTGNGYDVELKNFNNKEESGWTQNSLIFDGIDDYANIRNLDLSKYNDITICATYKILSMPNNKAMAVLSSNSSNPGRLFFGYGNKYLSYVANSNTYASNFTDPDIWLYGDNNLAEIGKVNNIVATYSGQSTTSSNRIYSNNKLVITNNTVMSSRWGNYNLEIGRSFGGKHLNNHPNSNIELYNLFIYEGSLNENEIKHNYEIDKYRFGIT